MVTDAKAEFGLGEYWTAKGQRAVVDAIVDGMLVGRVNIQDRPDRTDAIWYPVIWSPEGVAKTATQGDCLRTERKQRVCCSFWLNIYQSGPGQLRRTWEESLIEASRCEEDVLCRVHVPINATVGDGLR